MNIRSLQVPAETGGGGDQERRDPGHSVITFLSNVVVAAVLVASFSIPDAMSAYPERPIRYIVPAVAGSGPDIIARILTAELSRQMGQQFVVDNRPGGLEPSAWT